MIPPSSQTLSIPVSCQSPWRTLRGAIKLTLAGLMAALLLACKIVVTVPEGGKVVTEDGFVCRAGETCVIEVTTDTFDSTFRAMEDSGYTFTRWAKKFRSFCGHQSKPCHLSTTGFTDNPSLMEVLEGDLEFHLEPVFVRYDVDYWQQVLEDIGTGKFARAGYLYGTNPNVGQCDPGALKQAPKSRALEALTHVRGLHVLPGVDYDNSFNMQVQQTGLVQRANNYLNHNPSPGDKCYSAAASMGAQSSNLGSGTAPSDPAADIFGWTNDNNNLAALMEAGHRRWMLFPGLGYTSYGQVDGFTALKVFNFGKASMHDVPPDLEYVAMPYKHYPYVLVSKDPPTPWSISMVPPSGLDSSFNYFANATVEVIDELSGNSLPIRDLHKDNKRFGLANFMSWMVDGWNFDRQYMVKVKDIRMPGGGVRDVEYPVVVDLYDLFDVNHPLESTDSKSGTTLEGQFNTPKDEDTYRVTLKGPVEVTGSSEFSNWGFFVLVYNEDKRLLKSSDEPFQLNLPFGQDTIIISPCDENDRCYPSTKTYTVTLTPLE